MNILNSLPEQLQALADSPAHEFTQEQYTILTNAMDEIRRQQDEIYNLSDDLDRYLHEINELRELVEEYRANIECLEQTGRYR